MSERRAHGGPRLDPFAVACVTGAVALRLVLAFAVDAAPVGDAEWYYRVAESIASGHGCVFEGAPTAYRPVAYPAFLAGVFAIVGASPRAGAVANALLAGATLAIVYALAIQLFASRTAARVSVLLLALYPNHIAYTTLLLSETLFATLSVLGVWLLVADTRRRIALDAVAGAVLGAACLVRPQAALLPLLTIAWLYTTRSSSDHSRLREEIELGADAAPSTRSLPLPALSRVASVLRLSTARGSERVGLGMWSRVAVAVAVMVAVVAPWTVRNWRTFGRFVPISTNFGVNLLVGNNPYATGDYVFWSRDERIVALIDAKQRAFGSEAELDLVMRDVALEYVAEHPFEALARVPAKLAFLYAFDEDGIHQNYLAVEQATGQRDRGWTFYGLLAVNQTYYAALVVLFLLATVRRLRARPREPLGLAFWIVVGFTVYYLPFFGQSRFHHPMMVWMALDGASLFSRREGA